MKRCSHQQKLQKKRTSGKDEKKILIVTRQAGAVSAFFPLLKEFEARNWRYTILASDASYNIWSDLKILPDGKATVDQVDITPFNIILTGTSLKVSDDALFWKEGEKNDIPTVAFVESWTNYAERFTVNVPFDSTPNYIFVVDELMFNRLKEEGTSDEKLRVVGHPRFDHLYQLTQNRKKLCNNSHKKHIVFYTDPVLINIDNIEEVAGYSAEKVVESVLTQFEKSSSKYRITVKPHPRESLLKYQSIISKLNMGSVASVSRQDPIELMMTADVVFGMNSILLIDSAILQIPTFSFQPNRTENRNDITDRNGIIVITRWDGIFAIKKRMVDCFQKTDEKRVICYHKAAENFIAQLTTIAKQK